MNIRFTLLAEGTSDRALLPILGWALRQESQVQEIEMNFADPSRLPPMSAGLQPRIVRALELHPADILFVHRDADRRPHAERRNEVLQASNPASVRNVVVPVIPVRTTEAWLLVDATAIRRAANNPRGTTMLEIPRPSRLEQAADPKQILYTALRGASELSGRRLQKFDEALAAVRVSNYIPDFGVLRQLPAFREFEIDLRSVLAGLVDQ